MSGSNTWGSVIGGILNSRILSPATSVWALLNGGITTQIYPATPAGAQQTVAGLWAGSGAPSNANGNNGDFYFRGDTPGTSNQRIYIKSAGSWIALL